MDAPQDKSNSAGKHVLMTRRSWLKVSAGAASSVVVGGVAGWRYQDRIKTLQVGEIEQFLRKNFHYLTLDVSEEEVSRFYDGYKRYYAAVNRKLWHLARGRDEKSYLLAMDELATTFLLSTDFFLNGADETKPVRYVTLYSPYAAPCYDPVALGRL